MRDGAIDKRGVCGLEDGYSSIFDRGAGGCVDDFARNTTLSIDRDGKKEKAAGCNNFFH